MSITVVKVLRTISKIVLLIIGIGIIGYGGLMVYKSVVNKPQKVRITNVTDSAATITWVTDNPMRGVVYYRDKGSFLPGPLGLIGSKVAYDDRDFAKAQDDCVKAFNENANITKDANFTVDGGGFDCENIPVEKLGAYYTHSVTIKNLNESSTYFFVVGNGIWSWNVDGVSKVIGENDLAVANSFNFKTAKLLEEVPTPNIAYGTVYAAEYEDGEVLVESESKDSLAFAYLNINGINSQVISAVTNTDGGWTFDKSNFRDAEGNLITDLSKASMVVCSQYEDVNPKDCMEVKEDLNVDTDVDLLGNIVDDLSTGEKNRILEKWEELIGKVYAFDTEMGDYTSCGSVGVDNCNGAASQCVKKCYIPGTEMYKWVSIGTVGGGACSLPYSCGCSPVNKCEDKCENNVAKKRTCTDSAGYNAWTTWSNGSCGGNPCVSEATCTNGACENVANGARKVCKNNAWVTEAGSCSSSTQCYKVGDCKNVTLGHQICQTNYNWGSTISGACPINDGSPKLGGSCSELNKCVNVPPYKNGFICKGTIGNLTWQTHSGSCPTNDVQCKAVPKYSHYSVQGCEVYQLSGCDFKCGDASSTFYASNKCVTLFGMSTGYNKCSGNNVDPNKDVVVNVNEVDFDKFSATQLKNIMDGNGVIRDLVESKLNRILKKVDNRNCDGDRNNSSDFNLASKFCKALTGKGTEDKRISGSTCPNGDYKNYTICPPLYTKKIELVSKAYAEESTSSGYTLYLPEYGMYSFEIGDYQLTTSTTNGNTYHIFYIEANDKTGFQMPADPDNPKIGRAHV